MKNQLLFFVAIMLLMACNNSATSQDATDNTTVSIDQDQPIHQKVSGQIFKEKLASATEPIILDVRTPREVANGTLPDATVINFYDDDFKEQVSKLDNTKPVFVYCKSGGRSGQALKILKGMGFQEVYDLVGGYAAFPKD